jgi:hypothetical protein
MKFSLPSGEGSSYRVAGIRGAVRPSAAGGSYKLVLLDASGTVLQETTFDGDQDASVASISSRELFFNESSLTSLSYGTSYYVGVEHVSGGTGVYVGGIRVTGADDREAYPGGMSRCLGTSSGGAITDDNTVIPSIDLIIDTITAASGGGGSIVIGS